MPVPVKSVFIPVNTVMGQQIAQLQASNSPITDLSEGSSGRTLLEAWAITVSGQSAAADQVQLDSYLATATEEALDGQGSNWQVKRLPAVQAAGKVVITRESTTGGLIIPAGWGQLTVPPSVPGTEGVAVITTENAEFKAGQATVEVAAQAVIGGTFGNLASGTILTPINPVTGVNNTVGYKVGTTFTGGVNVESDDAYRLRIPLVVQARGAKGSKIAFEAATLSVPGVQSVGVIPAGGLRGDATAVLEGHVEVYYQGSAGLLKQVESAVAEAATLNQKVSTFAAVSLAAPRGQLRAILELKFVCPKGSNALVLQGEVSKVSQDFVEKVGIGNTVRYSNLVEAIHKAVPEIISIALPLNKLCLFGEATAGDIPAAKDSYVHLAELDTTITFEEI